MHCSKRVLLRGFLLCSAALAAVGCGGPSEPLSPVKGKVMYDGKLMTTGNVSFRPDTAAGNKNIAEPYGDIAPDGTYTILTNKRPGAPVGKYLVLVAASEPIDPNNASATPKSLIDPKYANLEQPLLKVEVVESPKADQYDLILTK